jgi:hypothetical protein
MTTQFFGIYLSINQSHHTKLAHWSLAEAVSSYMHQAQNEVFVEKAACICRNKIDALSLALEDE